MQVGRILLDGKPLKDLERKERAKQIAILPQSRAIPSLPAKTLVEHGRFSYQGFLRRKNREDEAAVEESMRFTNTLQYQWENVEELSGGERQRVFFARTLSQDSRIIILDVNCSNPLGCVFCVSSIGKGMGVTAYTKEREKCA